MRELLFVALTEPRACQFVLEHVHVVDALVLVECDEKVFVVTRTSFFVAQDMGIDASTCETVGILLLLPTILVDVDGAETNLDGQRIDLFATPEIVGLAEEIVHEVILEITIGIVARLVAGHHRYAVDLLGMFRIDEAGERHEMDVRIGTGGVFDQHGLFLPFECVCVCVWKYNPTARKVTFFLS